MVRSDQGPEFKNAIMKEYTALLGIGHRFGTAWRPMEQGLVENAHKETQKLFGILVKDVLKCFPEESCELYRVVEFMIYNTPGPHGYTPRDVDRRWSLSTPLARELVSEQVAEFEPVSEHAKNLFAVYKEIKDRVLRFNLKTAKDRSDRANRHRSGKEVRVGDCAMIRDSKYRKTGGRVP